MTISPYAITINVMYFWLVLFKNSLLFNVRFGKNHSKNHSHAQCHQEKYSCSGLSSNLNQQCLFVWFRFNSGFIPLCQKNLTTNVIHLFTNIIITMFFWERKTNQRFKLNQISNKTRINNKRK